MMKMKTAMVLAAVSVLVSGCAETKSQGQIYGVSAQDPYYMIYEQDGIGWLTGTEGGSNIDRYSKKLNRFHRSNVRVSRRRNVGQPHQLYLQILRDVDF
jgi:hypothetical protein